MQSIAIPIVPPIQQAALPEQPEGASLWQTPLTEPNLQNLRQSQPSLQVGLHRTRFDPQTSWRSDMLLEGEFLE